MNSRRPTRVLAVLFATIVLGVLLPPYINVNRWRPRIAGALAGAIGRDVTVGSVTLRLLPQPGFTLSRFAIADDASFSAEPVVRADEVTAALRLSSLLPSRLAIAQLRF